MSKPLPPSTPVLRVSYIWRDEVMSDQVFDEPQVITLGTTGVATIVTPDLGLPAGFCLFRPGARGYVMTLGASMGGEIQLSKHKQQVKDFVGGSSQPGDLNEPGGFRGSSISPGDFGVVELDESGDHSLFFQFVKKGPPLPRSPAIRDADLLLPAYAFAVLFVGFFLTYALAVYDYAGTAFLWPGRRELVADYLLNRPVPLVEPDKEEEVKAGKQDGEEEVKPASTVGTAGKSGGKGDKERKRVETPDKGEPDEALPTEIQVGLLSKKSRATFDKIRNRGGFDKRMGKLLGRMTGPANDGSVAGYGDGSGTGVGSETGTGTLTKGTGKGVGGDGSAHADVQTQGKLDTGGKRAARGTPGGNSVKEVEVKARPGAPSGKFGGLTKEQVGKVVKTRFRSMKACYSRELQRSKGLGGKLEISWRIDKTGKVGRVKLRKSTMGNSKVEDCVLRQVSGMKFPASKNGGTTDVTYPFIFGQS